MTDRGCSLDDPEVTGGRTRMFDAGLLVSALVVAVAAAVVLSFDRLIWFVMMASMSDAAVRVRGGWSVGLFASFSELPECRRMPNTGTTGLAPPLTGGNTSDLARADVGGGYPCGP